MLAFSMGTSTRSSLPIPKKSNSLTKATTGLCILFDIGPYVFNNDKNKIYLGPSTIDFLQYSVQYMHLLLQYWLQNRRCWLVIGFWIFRCICILMTSQTSWITSVNESRLFFLSTTIQLHPRGPCRLFSAESSCAETKFKWLFENSTVLSIYLYI